MHIAKHTAYVTEVAPWGFTMSVHADIEPGKRATFEDPGYGPEVCVFAVFVGDINIVEMLDNEQIERIEFAIINELDL